MNTTSLRQLLLFLWANEVSSHSLSTLDCTSRNTQNGLVEKGGTGINPNVIINSLMSSDIAFCAHISPYKPLATILRPNARGTSSSHGSEPSRAAISKSKN